jgi:translation initiation factor IF-3
MKQNKTRKERINNFINAPQLRVIDNDGTQLGIISNFEAKKIAGEKELDLVEINASSNPPICKIMDYGKYLYEKSKKEKQDKSTQVLTKEIRLSATTDDNAIEFKAKHTKEFLQKNNRVKVSVVFKGRTIQHPEYGRKILDQLLNLISEYGSCETFPKMEGKQLSVLVLPLKKEVNLQEKTEVHELVIKYIFTDFYSQKNIKRILNHLERNNLKDLSEWMKKYHPKYCKADIISVQEIDALHQDLGWWSTLGA